MRLAQDQDDVNNTFGKTSLQRTTLKQHWLFGDELTEKSLDGSSEQLKDMLVVDAE